ncbi:T9SS type A sorting domain-containing protein [Mariniflexile gromovii]|uniref:T9SS type A sorting domain-containing protein n=1 Tax=Mariniflexile gromovii TaxID=362523 RepID=A0ABS4BVZ9_9FLAO|nr:T9SS type A sorting domain-containing protein [Mariniflexile gromovii]MBP0904747.1 T9SS type A sorting domain-containing protein [Mariniflexile gromovii]
MKKILFLMLLYLTFTNINAQITTSITSVYLNNQTTVSNCNTLDFGTVQNNNLVLNFKLSRPQILPSGTGTLRIMLKLNSTSNPQVIGSPQSIQDTFWSGDSYESTISGNISASQVQQTGSSIYLEFETSGGNKTSSCSYPITKTPTPEFNLQPTSLNVSCGSTSSYVFTVVNVNNSSGTVSYSWNVGSGWKYNGVPVSGTFTTTTNVIQLSPASGTVLPSNVTMTPTLNGTTYPTKTTTISRPNISQTITAISGASTLCSGSTNYNFGTENVLTGQTVTWSLSNSTVATLSNASNTGVTLSLIGYGGVALTATITNGCGQSYSKTKNLFAGAPSAIAVARGTAQSEYCDIKYHYVPFIINQGTSLNFTYLYPNVSYSLISNGNGEYTYTFAFPKAYSGYFNMYAVVTNSCGSSNYESEGDFYIQSCSEIQSMASSNKSNLDTIFKIYPNPSNDVVYLDLVDANNVPEKNTEISASLYDMLGFEKEKVKIKDNKAVIDVSALPSGLYVLRITINGETETHLISRK